MTVGDNASFDSHIHMRQSRESDPLAAEQHHCEIDSALQSRETDPPAEEYPHRQVEDVPAAVQSHYQANDDRQSLF